MSIQSNINQGLSLMSLLVSQTPMAEIGREKAAEEAAQRAQEKQIQKDIAEYEAMATQKKKPGTEAEAAVQLEIAKKGQAAYKQAFEHKPSDETYEGYLTAEKAVADYTGQKEEIIKQEKEKAEKKAKEEEVQKNIADYEKLAEKGANPETEAEAEIQLEIAKKGQAAYKQAFEQNPTDEIYKQYRAMEQDVIDLKQQKERFAKKTQKTAEEKQAEAAKKAEDALKAERSRIFSSKFLEGVSPSYNVREVIKYGKE